jgi:hypothetical protein
MAYKRCAPWCIGFIGGLLASIIIWILLGGADETTTSRISPDESALVTLVEKKSRVPFPSDRRFEVWLSNLDSDTKRVVSSVRIYVSPDEGRPAGSERFIWSKDSSYFILLGRHFVADGVKLRTGELVYIMYHVPSKAIFCSSTQALNHPPLRRTNLAGIAFEFTLEIVGE